MRSFRTSGGLITDGRCCHCGPVGFGTDWLALDIARFSTWPRAPPQLRQVALGDGRQDFRRDRWHRHVRSRQVAYADTERRGRVTRHGVQFDFPANPTTRFGMLANVRPTCRGFSAPDASRSGRTVLKAGAKRPALCSTPGACRIVTRIRTI